MIIPIVNSPDLSVSTGDFETSTLQDIARSIGITLNTYPYYVVVKGLPATEDRATLVNLAQAIGTKYTHSESGFRRTNHNKVSFTKVQINPAKAAANKSVTQYSRTHLPLSPHTDSSYMPRPHELVAFQCVVSDSTGGESIMMPLDDVLQQLDHKTIQLLQAPVYPFGEHLHPILFGNAHQMKIRYYRAQIDRILERGKALLLDQYRAAMAALDTALQQAKPVHQFHLQAGHIVFMHNHRVLHGRTGFLPDSSRLLYRVRLHVDNFPTEDQPETSALAEANEPSDSQNHHKQFEVPLQPPDEGRVTFAPMSELVQSHVALANTLQKGQQFDEALDHYRQASQLAPENLTILRDYGKLLLHIGQFADAKKVFRQCLEIAPSDYDSSLALSSLVKIGGDNEKAQSILRPVIRQNPYVAQCPLDPQKPTLLRLRGLDGSAYGIVQRSDGTHRYLLQGGHFSIRHLVNKQHYNLIIFNIIDDNVDELENITNADLLINTIACPDLKRESLLAAARLIDHYPNIPLINHPHRVLLTTRERNALRLNLIPGVHFPQTEKLVWDGVSGDAMAREIVSLGFTFPIIVRLVGSQTGSTVAFIQNETELHAHFQASQANREYYIIQFKDVRRSDQQSPQLIFNKTRIFFIDGNFYPVANLFNNSWNVHSGDRYRIMAQTPWMQEKERFFLNDPINYLGIQQFDKLRKIRDVVGLDFFGIDFTLLEDGTLFIFELNAAMRHNFDHAENFPYTKPHLQRISLAFDTMLHRKLKMAGAVSK
ncbi:MAG: TauD/TfdA family dioxygenase [Cyanobacteria bacterium P01_F01_bin.56]